jgi:predicted Fe-S protein YdhL (DUF1289 family)
MSAMSVIGAVSPCINVCKMDADGGLCTGCLRTLDEIAAWSRASNAQRLSILDAIERRRADPRHVGEEVS